MHILYMEWFSVLFVPVISIIIVLIILYLKKINRVAESSVVEAGGLRRVENTMDRLNEAVQRLDSRVDDIIAEQKLHNYKISRLDSGGKN